MRSIVPSKTSQARRRAFYSRRDDMITEHTVETPVAKLTDIPDRGMSTVKVGNYETLVPLILTADTIEDYATAVALALRQRGERAWLPMLQQHSSRLPQLGLEMSSLHAHVGTNDLIPTSEWVQFQRLWWRWQAPNDSVSPMRWYLTAAWSATQEPATLSEAVDLCMQELMLLS